MEDILVAFKAGDTRVFKNVLGDSINIPENGVFLLFKMKGGETVSILLDSIKYIVETPIEESDEE